METKNPSEMNLKNRMLIEAAKAFTRNDLLTGGPHALPRAHAIQRQVTPENQSRPIKSTL